MTLLHYAHMKESIGVCRRRPWVNCRILSVGTINIRFIAMPPCPACYRNTLPLSPRQRVGRAAHELLHVDQLQRCRYSLCYFRFRQGVPAEQKSDEQGLGCCASLVLQCRESGTPARHESDHHTLHRYTARQGMLPAQRPELASHTASTDHLPTHHSPA